MATIKECAEGIATTVQNATGLRSFAYIPDDINPPTFAVTVDRLDIGAFALGQLEGIFLGIVFVSKADDRTGQTKIYDYMSTGSGSVWRALFETPALGLEHASCGVQTMRQLGVDEIAAYGYYGAVFEILVLTTGA
jgi:hypothetical protein